MSNKWSPRRFTRQYPVLLLHLEDCESGAPSASVEFVFLQQCPSGIKHRKCTRNDEHRPLWTVHDAPAYCFSYGVPWENCGSKRRLPLQGPIKHWWRPDLKVAQKRYRYSSARSARDRPIWHADRHRDLGDHRPQNHRLSRQPFFPFRSQTSRYRN